jgi:DOPA 4,5-dioxygenase
MIQSFHAHIYYRNAEERARAATLREKIAQRFLVQLGRWHDNPIGPHERGMYQVNFNPEVFSAFIPWLMLNRDSLTILLHPNTGHPRADHLKNSFWFGEVLRIENSEMLPEASNEDERAIPNTTPTIPSNRA